MGFSYGASMATPSAAFEQCARAFASVDGVSSSAMAQALPSADSRWINQYLQTHRIVRHRLKAEDSRVALTPLESQPTMRDPCVVYTGRELWCGARRRRPCTSGLVRHGSDNSVLRDSLRRARPPSPAARCVPGSVRRSVISPSDVTTGDRLARVLATLRKLRTAVLAVAFGKHPARGASL